MSEAELDLIAKNFHEKLIEPNSNEPELIDLLAGAEALMGIEEIRLGFEDWADKKGLDLSVDFFNLKGIANPYTEEDTMFAYEIWCTAIHARHLAA